MAPRGAELGAMARVVTAAGVTSEDIAHLAFGYDLSTGAFGLHYALDRVVDKRPKW